MVQGDDEHLDGLLGQGFPVVGEEQVVVGDPVAHRVIGTHGVEEGGEEGQGVSAGGGVGKKERKGCRDATGLTPPPGPPSLAPGDQQPSAEPSAPPLSTRFRAGPELGPGRTKPGACGFLSRGTPPCPCLHPGPAPGWAEGRRNSLPRVGWLVRRGSL